MTSRTLPTPAAPESGSRTVEIASPSSRGETIAVIRLAVVIVGAAWLYFSHLTNPSAVPGARAGDLAPFQKLFRDLAPHEQRTIRELQEGLLEAENVRSSSGQWPTAAALAEQGIPPFAADPTAPGRYGWTQSRQGLAIEYIGIPASPTGPAYLLQTTEPDPQAPPHPATPADEEHHRLADGTLIHVSVWLHPAGSPSSGDAFVVQPAAAGWNQILTGRDTSSAPPP